MTEFMMSSRQIVEYKFHSVRNRHQSHPISREPTQLDQQSVVAAPVSTVRAQHRDREIPRSGHDTPN